MKKSILALMLALCMLLGLVTGCGDQKASEPSAASAASEVTEAPEASEAPEPVAAEPESTVEAVSAEEPEIDEPTGPEAYYASDELTEISVLFQFPAFFQGFFPEGWISSPWWEALGEKTNTSFTLREVSNMAWQENVNLLCASGDLPDMVTNIGSVYNGGLSQAIRDEMIYDLAPYIQEYAPHYYQAITQDEYTLKTAVNDEGQMGAMYPILEEVFPVTNGLWIRQDWLEELDKEIPTTPDELFDVLKLFRDNYGATTGFYQMIRPNTNEAGIAAEGIWNAFGPASFYLDDNGEIQYGLMQDYYYDYLAYLKKLAGEGMFLTSDMTDQTSLNLFISGSIGVEGDSPDNVPSYLAQLGDPNAVLVPMAALGEPTEYCTKASYISGDAGGNISISTNCENPEIIVKALDYLFTEEGAVLSSYGIEGLSYENNADGNPQLTEMILNNPDGVPFRAAMGYWLNPGLPGYIDYARGQVTWDDIQKSAFDVWESAYTGDSGSVSIDALALTEEEQDAISVYKSDMVTYATGWVNDVVFGSKELTDAEIAEFQQTMEDTMHISDILEVYNDAYERFQARGFE